jgi:hypothetical protein
MIETRHDELQLAVKRYHIEHPKVWDLFCGFTFELINRGFKHGSAYAVFERIRWETDQADSDGVSTFKANNNYRPFYARRFMRVYTEHEGFFRLRHQTSKDTIAIGRPELGPKDFPEVRL